MRGLAELGKGRAFPSISDARPVLTWVETWTCPDPEVSAGIPPSLRMSCYPCSCAGVVLGAAFTPILANPRKTCSGNPTCLGAGGKHCTFGTGTVPKRTRWACREGTNPVTALLWDMHVLVGLPQGMCIAAAVGQAFRLESLPPPPPPAPAQGRWGNASCCGRTGAISLPGFHHLQSE